jgi:ERI1 exoribonuclease 3
MSTSSTFKQYDYLIILDFEATCWDEKKTEMKEGGAQEIIEFPSVVIDIRKQQCVDEISQFVKPYHNPKLSAFCKQLTSITQEQVDGGISFIEAFKAHQAFVAKYPKSLLVTCGDWDLKTMLPNDAQYNMITIPSYYTQWINIKTSFSKFYGTHPCGMQNMLKYLKQKLVGTHHRGIDDCRNIAKIALHMLQKGWVPEMTSRSPVYFQKRTNKFH